MIKCNFLRHGQSLRNLATSQIIVDRPVVDLAAERNEEIGQKSSLFRSKVQNMTIVEAFPDNIGRKISQISMELGVLIF